MVKLDRALWFDPQMVEAYHVRAICHWRWDRFDEALADYSATVRLKPDYVAGYASRGAVHRQKGDLDAALADWDTAIRLDPAPPMRACGAPRCCASETTSMARSRNTIS